MEVIETNINGVRIIRLEPIRDVRGFFVELFNRDKFIKAGIECSFSQECTSCSDKGTVRGLHFQTGTFAQAKLIRCSRGKVWDVSVDLRKSSSSYLKQFTIELEEDDWTWVYLPTGLAHGFAALSDDTEFVYKISGTYAPEHATGIHWQDPFFDIDWPIESKDAIIIDRDKNLPYFDQERVYFA